jgi:hypothetical protein
MLDKMSFFHFIHCDTLTDCKELSTTDDDYLQAVQTGLEQIGVKAPSAIAQIVCNEANSIIDLFEFFGTCDDLVSVLEWLRVPSSVGRLGVLVVRGMVKDVTRKRCEKISTTYLHGLHNADVAIRLMCTPFRVLDMKTMRSLILKIEPDGTERDEELLLVTILDVLTMATDYHNNGRILIPFTRAMVRIYRDSFNHAPPSEKIIPVSNQQDQAMVDSLKVIYSRARRLHIVSQSFFLSKLEECTYMVAMNQTLIELLEDSTVNLRNEMNDRWTVLETPFLSGDVVNLHNNNYLADILRSNLESIPDFDHENRNKVALAQKEKKRIDENVLKRFCELYGEIDTIIELV